MRNQTIGKVIVAFILFLMVLAFLGAYLETFYHTSLANVLIKIGSSLYSVFESINPSVQQLGAGLSEVLKARLGWMLTFLVTALAVIWAVFIDNALNIMFKENVSEENKKVLLSVLTIVFIAFMVLSPVFPWLASFAIYLLGAIPMVGVLIFIVGLGLLLFSSLSGKGFEMTQESIKKLDIGIKSIAGTSLSEVFKDLRKEYIDLGKLTKDIDKEIYELKDAELALRHLKERIEHIRNIKEDEDIKNVEKAVKNIKKGIEAIRKIIYHILKDKIRDEVLERSIERLEEGLKKTLRKEGISYVDIKRDERFLKELYELDVEISKKLKQIEAALLNIEKLLSASKIKDLSSLVSLLDTIIEEVNKIIREIEDIQKIEIREEHIVRALENYVKKYYSQLS